MLHRLYVRTLTLAGSRYAPWWLAGIAFAEASFFPIPPDVLLLLMGLARPERAFRFAAVCTVGSVAGGALGYAIGFFLFDALMRTAAAHALFGADPLGAFQADRPRAEGLQQHFGGLDPSLGGGGAALCAGDQAGAAVGGLALEGEAGLQRAQQQDRRQGQSQSESESDPDRGGLAWAEEARWLHLAELRRSASARIDPMASPAGAPSRR